ncbi:MAG: hypothetical protein FWG90_11555 [Oscillospiraceae bacterium]|nr:hypothetical protein [Oscillospiraceae bacterium]
MPGSSESRWVDPSEIKEAVTVKQINVDSDDCEGCGLPIISDGRATYVDNSYTHSLVFGATGSKKTRLFGMSLMNYTMLGSLMKPWNC